MRNPKWGTTGWSIFEQYGRKAWQRWLKRKHVKPSPIPVPPKPPVPPSPHNITMYDSITVGQIPAGAQAVAGYVGGHWPTYPELVKKFPKAKKLSIAVASYQNADCLDVEPGDATPPLVPSWLKRQHALGKKRPVVYINVARAQALVNQLKKEGFDYGKDYLLWTAHYYSPTPHICGPQCGFGMKVKAHATQYWDKALGRNLDVSLCTPTFFS